MKRRAPIPRSGSTTGDLEKDISQEQLAGIGKASLRYNEIEDGVEWLVAVVLRLPQPYWREVVSV